MDEMMGLQQLGLTKVEAKVYLALMKLGSTTTGPLIKKTELHRATVYDALKRLQQKGLVSYIIKEKTKHFEATPAEHLFDKIKEEEQLLQKKSLLAKNLVKELVKIQEEATHKEEAHLFKGIRGIKIIFEDILKHKEYFVIGSSGKFKAILEPYYDLYQKRKKQLKIKSLILLPESLKGSKYVETIHGTKKYLPHEFDSPTATFIFGNKVAMIIFVEQPIAFLLESKELVKSYRHYFDLLWRISTS